jgi:putative hemolysin
LQATALFGEPLRSLLRPVEPALEKLLMLDRLRTAFAAASGAADSSAFESLLRLLSIDYTLAPDDLARIPASGPAALVVNHPYGFLEGAILGAVLPRIRPDVRFLANSMLAAIPELRRLCIFVDPFGGRDAAKKNRGPTRECLDFLRNGGLLVIFPAGEVAHLDWSSRAITDPPWHPGAARLVRLAGCPVIPAFF